MSRRLKFLVVTCAILLIGLCINRRFSGETATQTVAPRGSSSSPNKEILADHPSQERRVTEAATTKPKPAETQATDVIQDFTNWMREFASTDQLGQRESRNRGIALAQTRRNVLRELIETDPQAALAASLPIEMRRQLPPEIQQYLETPVNARADYEVTIGDDLENQRREVLRRARINNQTFQVFTFGHMAELGTTSDLPINGMAIDDALAVADSPIRVLSPVEAAEARALAGTVDPVCAVSGLISTTPEDEQWIELGGERFHLCGTEHLNLLNHEWTIDPSGKWLKAGKGLDDGGPRAMDSWSQGPKTVLFMRVNFPDDLAEPISESAAYDLMNNVSAWIVANSYGTSSMITTVTPLLTLPCSKALYEQLGDGQLLTDARAVARQAGYDTADFDFDAVRFTTVPGFGYSGKAYVRGKGLWLQNSSVGVACHEFGHNYGLWHANYWSASQASIIGPGSHSEYGDIFDTMGSAGAGDKHFNANHRNKIDWLGDNYVRTITDSGSYRLHAFDIDSLTPGRFYGLKIRKDYDRDYWLELRHLFASNKYVQNGVFLRWDAWAASDGGAHLLDATPGSPAGNSSKDDAPLVVGRTFVDEGAGLYITPVAIDGSGQDKSIDIVVNTGNFAGNQAPAVSIQASATQVNASEEVVFTAAATDNDGDDLAYEWDFGDLTFGPNLPVVTNTWSAIGDYVVRCRVSDMKGGFASAQLVVGVGNPTSFRVSGRITDGLGNPVEGVRVHNGSASSASYRGGFTDSDGNFVITRLGAGSVTVSATRYGYNFAPLGGWSNPVSVGSDLTGIDFTASPMPVVGWSVIDGDAGEADNNSATIRLTRTGPTDSALIVKYNRSGTATFSTDYSISPTPGGSAPYSLTIPAGSNSIDVTLTPAQDTSSEGPENVLLTLAENTGYKIGWQAEARIEIVDDETPGKPFIYISSSADNQATETGNDTASFTINRVGNKSGDITVNYSIGGTATPDVDFTPPAGSVVIPAGETSMAVTFATIDDTLVEGDETVEVTLTPDPVYNISGGTTTLTIQDDDPPLVKLAVIDNLAVEGGSATAKVVVQRIGNLAPALTVNYITGGTATVGADYQTPPGSITIPAGAASATITLTALNDSEVEGDESVAVTLSSNPDYNIGLPGSAVVIIQDNEIPTVTFSATDDTATEGGLDPGAFTFSRGSNTAGDLTIFVAISGQAGPGSDYAALPASIVIPDGSSSATLAVFPVDDGYKEADEKVTVTLQPSSEYNIGTTGPVSVTIQDDDTAAIAAVGFESPALSFAESQTSVKLPVILSAPVGGNVSVDYLVTGGSATGGADFNLAAGTLTFAANQTLATINLAILNDSLAESNETVVIELSSPVGVVLDSQIVHTLTIVDDDAAVFTIAANDDSASENGAAGNFRVSRAGDSDQPATVLLQITGTASSPSDFQVLPTSILIPAGAGFIDLPVIPVNDQTDEVDETVVVRITGVTSGRIGSPNSAVVTIIDNADTEPLPEISLAAVDEITTEGVNDPARVRISRSGDPNGDLTIRFSTAGTADVGVDVPSLASEIVIPDGQSEAFIDIQAVADALDEPAENLSFNLSADPAYTLGTGAGATIFLFDSPFMRWQFANFPIESPDSSITDPSADPDGDGMNNFTEYAFNRNPNQADESPLFTGTFLPIGETGDRLPVITYQRRIDRSDVDYVLGVAADVDQWDDQSIELDEVSAIPDANGVTETVQTQVLAPLSHFERRFVRLRVIRR